MREFTEEQLQQAMNRADVWTDGGYTPESRAYWNGMRDTLRYLLGQSEVPTSTGPGTDIAAMELMHAGVK